MKASQLLESETFGSGNRNYFIDFIRSANNSDYIRICRSDRQTDQSYKRSSVVIFQEDFFFLIESFSMLFASVGLRKACRDNMIRAGLPDKTQNLIKSWASELRPREKMMAHGPNGMDNAELLAILIGSGTYKLNAAYLARKILDSVSGDLDALEKLDVKQLCRFKGIGQVKALTIIAALALASRRSSADFQPSC